MSDFQIPVNDGVESLRVDAELTQGKRFLQRMMSSPALGCIFFRKELSERQELLLAEFTLAAITRASSSALSFVFAAGFVAYLSASVNHEVYGAIIFLIGLAAAVARMAAKRRFGKDLLSDPSIRRLAHSQVVVASVMGSLMWAIGLVVVYPALDADLRTVFLLLVVGSTTVGAGFMTLAPPSYLLHISILTVTFALSNLINPTEHSTILTLLLILFAYEMFKGSYDSKTSSFGVASRFANSSHTHAQKQDLLHKQLVESHAKVVTTLRASAESRNLHLAKISHEFRTPLQIIVGTVDLLSVVLASNKDKTVASSIENLNSASKQLLASSDDLADYLRSNSTQIKIKPENIELVEFLSGCVALHEPLAKKKGLDLRFKHDDASIECVADATRLRQIVTNLIGNAVKYTTSGSIELECKRQVDGRTSIVVRDTGSGISEEQQKSIFEPWFRADESKQGLGLGLAIVKATADAIGAKIQLKSTLGVGTEMTLLLPMRKIKKT